MGEDKEQETSAVFVYRVSTESEWNELQQTGSTLGGDLDKQTGCIHLSTHSQVKGVLENFFSGRTDLYLLKLDASKLGEGLIYESADGLNFFPHFYGPSGSFTPLTVNPIIEASKLELVDGKFKRGKVRSNWHKDLMQPRRQGVSPLALESLGTTLSQTERRLEALINAKENMVLKVYSPQ